MRKGWTGSLGRVIACVLALESAIPLAASSAQTPAVANTLLSAAELDSLLAPIALYPDPLLAQILIASTYPDQIKIAAQWVRENGTLGIDDQPWDVSVRSVAHYPTILST